MKYWKILIRYNAYFKIAVFNSRENIKCCISLQWRYKLYFTSEIFSIDFHEPTSEFQMPVIFLLVDKHTKCVYSFS